MILNLQRRGGTSHFGCWLPVVLAVCSLIVTCKVSVSALTSVESPSVNVEEKEMVLSAGDRIELRCTGDQPVTWKYPSAVKDDTSAFKERITEIKSGQIGSSLEFESNLTITELNYLDTGYYQCEYSNKSDTSLVASSYVYVFDKHHLLVADDEVEQAIYVVQNRKATLPWCRSTHPDVEVILKKRKRNKPPQNDVISFDPRIGIIIANVSSYFDGAFLCSSVYRNFTQSLQIELMFKESTRRPPKVTLVSDHKDGRTLTTETVQFTCVAVLSSPFDLVRMTWSYPNENTENKGRIWETQGHRKRQIVEAHLTVRNFTLSDMGSYICSVKDHDDKKGTSELTIVAYEKSFINLTADQFSAESQLNLQSFILSVDVAAYPVPQLIWLKDGHRINQSLENIKYSGVTKTKLKIFNIHVSDAGLYTLMAWNRDVNASLDITLNVNYPPTLSVQTPVLSPSLYLANESYILECHSKGFPEPNIQWLWQSCASAGLLPAADNWKLVNHSKNIPKVLFKAEASRLIINAKESGWLKCEASNKHGISSVVTEFFVTDITDGFEIKVEPHSQIAEGMNVSASCLVSRFLYELSDLFWTDENFVILQNDSESILALHTNSGKQLNSSGQITISSYKDEYYTISTLSLLDIKSQDEASYVCIALDSKGNQHIQTWNLTITAVPHLLTPRDDDTLLHFTERVLPERPYHLNVIIGVSVFLGFIVFFLILIIAFLCRRSRYKFSARHLEELLHSSTSSKYNPSLPLDEQTDILSYDPQWEFSKDRLKFDIVIGKGAFGIVYRAKAFGINSTESVTTVAVKTVKDCGKMEQLKALISELKVLIHLGQHVNILNVLGAVTQDIGKGSLYVIMEYCYFGCLRDHLIRQHCHFDGAANSPKTWTSDADVLPADENDYLNATRSHHGSTTIYKYEQLLTKKDLVCYAFQIARGLEYLHSKKYIHRDLAARNILLADGNIIKICDFGLAKDCYKYKEYYKKSSTPVPIKWMAIESLTHNLYTTKSDIWSYGVVLWELFTVGGNPYPTLKMDKTFIDLLNSGFRLERPYLAEDLIYNVMLNCWNSEPAGRPDASQMVETFGGMLEATVKQHYIDLKMQTVDYLQMNTKSGCLELLGYSNIEEQSNSADRTDIMTRMRLPSYESGFDSIARVEEFNNFEYLPPGTVDSNSDSAWSQAVFDFGSPLPSPGPYYENTEMILLENHAANSVPETHQHFVQNNIAGRCSLSSDFSSGISDMAFNEPDSFSPPPSTSIANSMVTSWL